MSSESQYKFRSGFVEGERYLDPPDFVSSSDYLGVLELLTKESRDKSIRFQRLAPKLENLLNKCSDEINSKIGQVQLMKYREIVKKIHKTIIGSGRDQPPLDQNGLNKLSVAKREAREKIQSIMREASVDAREINNIRRKYARMISDLEKPKGDGLKLEVAEIVDKSKVPKKVLEATETNTPITKKAPYQYNYYSYYWYLYYEWYVIGPEFLTFLDRTSGMIGDRVHFEDAWSGEGDKLTVDFDTDVGFFKNIPTTGKWDVWLILNCGDAWANQYYFDSQGIWDESDIKTDMTCSIKFVADTFPPAEVQPTATNPGSRGLWWEALHIDGDPDDGWYPTFPGWNGQDHYFHFTTESKIPAKNSTFIRVGFFDDIYSFVNDYDTKLTWKNKWFLKQVSIDILT